MKALRLSEKWFQRGLWLVAFVFAWFLIGLGGTIVGDLPKVEHAVTTESLADPEVLARARVSQEGAQTALKTAQDARDQAQLRLQSARAETSSHQERFQNWLATRSVTEQSEQNPEVIQRTKELDGYKAIELRARQEVQTLEKQLLDAHQQFNHASEAYQNELARVQPQYVQASRAQELRVFGYRLAVTLPLILLAGWLFKTQRKTQWWPFVWGFIFCALFAFFVELVPYLPSYGGYVRYIVGIVLTVVVGRYAIQALQRYLDTQKAKENMPEVARRQELDYDLALGRLAKGICPGCERPVDLKNDKQDFCSHCGIGLFKACGQCHTRHSVFTRFCFHCGFQEPRPGMHGHDHTRSGPASQDINSPASVPPAGSSEHVSPTNASA